MAGQKDLAGKDRTGDVLISFTPDGRYVVREIYGFFGGHWQASQAYGEDLATATREAHEWAGKLAALAGLTK